MPRRQDLKEFAAQHPDLMPVLIEQMKAFLTESVILSHQNDDVIDHMHRLLPDHRKFIKSMEDRFILAGHPELVPLPKWDPATTIPDGFFEIVRVRNESLPRIWNPMEGLVSPRKANRMDIDPDYNSRNDKPRFPDRLRPPELFEFKRRHDLEHFIGHMIGPNYHSECHAKLGGPFFNEYTTAGALIFWPLHALLDDVYFDWQQSRSAVEIVHIEEDPMGYDRDGEYVELVNQRVDSIDLTGWVLSDAVGHRFTFPAFRLEPEGVVRVWTGRGDNDGENLYWGMRAAVWNNNRDTAVLTNAAGEEVSRYEYDRLIPW